jgi:hypothetical protein
LVDDDFAAMQTIAVILGAIGVIGFGVSAFSLFICWGYFLLKITGNSSFSMEQDRMVAKLSSLFLKTFLFSIAYLVGFIILIHLIGLPK